MKKIFHLFFPDLFEEKDSKAMGKNNFRGRLMDYVKFTEELCEAREKRRALREKRDEENAKCRENCDLAGEYYKKK
ncbi:hypothetical protein T05_4274 [Trichinella murrelli]|uniref:Uncharacterized protein n=1 Tax=Trichinella murrelli TaxID=144512 RepID=A0A0V0T3Q5_9BILA|nr:hypothetical protein T05_4274 [Trichinella murrelli]